MNLLTKHTYVHLTALCPGLPRWAGTRKVKPIWILREQETVSGSGISWVVCKSASLSRQITMPAPHHSVFTGRMPFLPPNQQRQSTEGITKHTKAISRYQTCQSSTHNMVMKTSWIGTERICHDHPVCSVWWVGRTAGGNHFCILAHSNRTLTNIVQ